MRSTIYFVFGNECKLTDMQFFLLVAFGIFIACTNIEVLIGYIVLI